MKKKCTLITLVFALILIGCKPVQTIQERHFTTVDSASVLTLKEVIAHQWSEIVLLKTTTERLREENTTLLNETQQHEITYDTSGTVTDGKYPISSEVITTSKSILERTIKEQENIIQEYKKEINIVTIKNSNLEYITESLRNEVKELKSKTTPAFHFKSFLAGIVMGFIIMIALLLFLKMR